MTDRYDELRAALAEMTATATTVAAMYRIGVIMRGAEALLSERDSLLNEAREAAELDALTRAQLTIVQDENDSLLAALKPFGLAAGLIDEGLSIAVAMDDGTIMASDEAFLRARALTAKEG